MEILDYRIPPFKSVAWVSMEACSVWEHRIKSINTAMLDAAMTGLADQTWPARRMQVEGALYFHLLANTDGYGLRMDSRFLGDKTLKGPVFYEILMTRKNREVPQEKDGAHNIAIPSCCLLANKLAQTKQRTELLWETALETEGRQIRNLQVWLTPDIVSGPIWQQLLVNPTGYHLCSFKCVESQQTQLSQIEAMKEYGFAKEAVWLEQIYSWPVEWSASHGIAELKTPIIKIAYATDPTAQKMSIHIRGNDYPQEGALGLDFPYRRKPFLKITDSRSFKEGLKYGTK